MEYRLISNYKHISSYKESFNDLAKMVFGIDFQKWYEKGCWNDHYVCYSYLHNEQVIANASINKMTVVWNGKEYNAIQIGTVMTHPDYRNQGLSGKLMNHILEKYENETDFIYLFANDTVLDFYPKFGFEKVQESSFSLAISDLGHQQVKGKSLRQLNIENQDDIQLMKEFARRRIPVSSNLGVIDNEHLLMFYFIQVFNDSIFYIEEEEVIVIVRREDDQIHVFDIINKKKIELNTILNNLVSEETKLIHFYFTPPEIDGKIHIDFISESDDTLFVRPILKKGQAHFLFPITSHA